MIEPNQGGRDAEQAIAELAERLPEPLRPLARLAYNYWWSWTLGGAELFRGLDPDLWARSSCNPRWIIEAVAPRRLRELAQDAELVARIAAYAARLDAELRRPAAVEFGPADGPIAYFCSEFGVHCSLPLYGGGLGILAGDLLKAASDAAIPMIGIGLLYRHGYFHQRLDVSGWQHEYWTTTPFERMPIVRVTGEDGRPVTVDVEIRGRPVHIQVWRVDLGRVPLYLLDTDREDNHPIDRWITARLYIGDRHTRLAQYAVLGVGGARMLAAIGIRPPLVHLNEGHAALSAFERLRTLMRDEGLSVEAALARVRETTVFTTHTPVEAGNEWYAIDEVEPAVGAYVDGLGIERSIVYGLGRRQPGDPGEPVNITPLALRTSRMANAVSRRHGEVARQMWQPLWPDRAARDVPIVHVTNGVHTTTWMASAMQSLLDRHLEPGWRERVSDRSIWARVAAIPDEELWQVRRALREDLVEYVRGKSVLDRLSRGEDPGYVEAAARAFDPDALTIGFARRVATYKRLHLLTQQLERGLRLLADRDRPIQLVIAGKAHPADDEAKSALRAVMAARRAPNVGGHIAFLEDYDMHIAPRIVAGVDVWLNLPRPPLEASGTSGMKVVLNGGLNLSVLDGWWEEAYDGENGWAIASHGDDPGRQDERDAIAMYNLLEHEVLPLFYERDGDGLPHRWLARVKTSLQRLASRFSADRMLRDYVTAVYAPSSGGGPG
jgi:starch phosphorylase